WGCLRIRGRRPGSAAESGHVGQVFGSSGRALVPDQIVTPDNDVIHLIVIETGAEPLELRCDGTMPVAHSVAPGGSRRQVRGRGYASSAPNTRTRYQVA